MRGRSVFISAKDIRDPSQTDVHTLIGRLTLIKIYKYLQTGLTDKNDRDVDIFVKTNQTKDEIESDCCVCFNNINRDNNPIVYCSGEKYR